MSINVEIENNENDILIGSKSYILKDLIKSFSNSSKRTRTLFVFLLLASIIAYSGYWNSRPCNWSVQRVSRSQDMRNKILEFNSLLSIIPDTNFYEINLLSNIDTSKSSILSSIFNTKDKKIKIYSSTLNKNEILEKKLIEKNRSFVKILFNNNDDIKYFFNKYGFDFNMFCNNVKYRENVLKEVNDIIHYDRGNDIRTFQYLKIPILGIDFDINDLAILSGMCFCVILFLIFYSLYRQYLNLAIIIDYIKDYFKIKYNSDKFIIDNLNKIEQRYCIRIFQLIASHHVIIVPPITPKTKYFNFFPKLLFLIPLIVQLLITYNDFMTYKIGKFYSLENTILLYVISGCMLFIILLITIFVIYILLRIDKLWKNIPANKFEIIDSVFV